MEDNYKTRQIVFVGTDSSGPPTPQDIFQVSDYLADKLTKRLHELRSTQDPIEKKLHEVLRHKSKIKKIFNNKFFSEVFKDFFFIDGAIRLNEADLDELSNSFSVIDESGAISKDTNNAFINYASHLAHNFCYFRGQEIIFRGPQYYFLFEGLEYGIPGRSATINDFSINNINVDQFQRKVNTHFNAIHQHFNVFGSYILGQLAFDLDNKFEEFASAIETALSDDILLDFRRRAAEEMSYTGDEKIDRMQREMLLEILDETQEFKSLVSTYKISKKAETLPQILTFVSDNKTLFNRLNVHFRVDLDEIINGFSSTQLPKPFRKVLLGLLDAKINTLAFAQNIAQIISGEHFLDTEYSGKLVFSQSTVRQMKKLCPDLYGAFKQKQKEARELYVSNYVLNELDTHVAIYLDVLLDDNNTGYARLVGSSHDHLPELGNGESEDAPLELHGTWKLMSSFFELFNAYTELSETKSKTKSSHHSRNTSAQADNNAHQNAKRNALKKLIRLYREENDPLIMIQTAQNALNTILKKGFAPRRNILHIMGVNYGGALTGVFAKRVFMKTVSKGQVPANSGGLIYSIYDVKNANSFSKLTDYPYIEILNDTSLPESVKKRLRDQNWLLIFDDNTHSGETLYNLKNLANDSLLYGHVDVFACRASVNLNHYKAAISDQDRLDIIANAATTTRKTIVNPEKKRYKELLGTIVGNRMAKILQPLSIIVTPS